MEFDNPAAGGPWGNQHNSDPSDFSEGEGTSGSKKEKILLGSSKKKDKEKKKEKETRYATLGDESSNDEDDGKSSGKSKKKAFKIGLAKKEKKDKKEGKEQDVKEPKDNKKKEKKEKEKPKLKLKKSKHTTDSDSEKTIKGTDSDRWPPIFGVPLEVAVDRSKCHDGVRLPVVVRECIDFIEEHGLNVEGIYRSSGVKSKISKLRSAYNNRQSRGLVGSEPSVVASLLKLFLRELPDPVLTTRLAPSFEEVSSKSARLRMEGLRDLLSALPECNLRLVQWVFVHMGHVIQREKVNKMTLQNVSIVLSPTMQISHRVLNAIFEHSSELFQGVQLKKYIPPISGGAGGTSSQLPESPAGIEEELAKQESLLAELHKEISSGLAVSRAREEQLWEQQRIVTQLKRNLRTARISLQVGKEVEKTVVEEEEHLDFSLQTPAVKPDSVIVEKNDVSGAISSGDPQAGKAIMSSPEDPDRAQQEHKVTVQIHRNPPGGDQQDQGETKKVERGKNHVTVIKLNQTEGGGPSEPVASDYQPPTVEVGVTKQLEEAKGEGSPGTHPVIPPVTVLTPKSPHTTPPAKLTTPPRSVTVAETSPVISSPAISSPSSDSVSESQPKSDAPVVSFCTSSSLSARAPAASSIPLLPPPPASSKTSRGQRCLVPPDNRVKSKSLPRGLPSDGSVFFRYDQEEAEEQAKEDESVREAMLLEEMRLKFEFEELLNLKSELERRRKTERREISELQEEIATMQTLYQYRTYSVDSSEDSSEAEDVEGAEQREAKLALLARLAKEKKELETRKSQLQAQLLEERSACLQLRVDIRMEQERIRRRGQAPV